MKDFYLQGDCIELYKLLKAAGLCGTGGAAKQAIAAGLVTVDGETETRKGRKLRSGQRVAFEGTGIRISKHP